jgi:hypothetical protein
MLSRGIKTIFSFAVMVSFTGCAASAKNVNVSYVSPIQYQRSNCDQIRQELTGCSRTEQQLAGQQGRVANKDAWDTGIGMVVFW